MDAVQTVTGANVLSGSNAQVDSGFEVAKVCFEIAKVLSGLEESASSIKTQRDNIIEDVEEFKNVLRLLDTSVQNECKFTIALQQTIAKFETDVREYDRVVNKFRDKHPLKQLVFHRQVDDASANTKKTAEKLKDRVKVEIMIDSARCRDLQTIQ